MIKFVFVFLLALGHAATAQVISVQSLAEGDIFFMSVSVTPGVGEPHPYIQLKNGSQCDLLSLHCLEKAEFDFGDGAYDALRRAVRQMSGRLR